MRRVFVAIMALQALGMGLMAPILSLFILSRGADLSLLALVMGLYAAVTAVLELPTGILADRLGRKRMFLLSQGLTAAGAGLMLCGQSLGWIWPAVTLTAAGRAFGSGSMDALIIDWHLRHEGEAGLGRASMLLNLCDGLGLAAGALLGGLLPRLTQALAPEAGLYDGNLALRLLLAGAVAALAWLGTQEGPAAPREPTGWRRHLRDCGRLVLRSRALGLLLAGVLTTGLALGLMETYWQPQMQAMLPDPSQTWPLGAASFGCFVMAAAGNALAGRRLRRGAARAPALYLLGRLALALALGILALARGLGIFIPGYLAVYLSLGGANVAEGVLFNRQVPSAQRASMLSAGSLTLQLGGLTACALGSLLAARAGIGGLWALGALALAAAAAAALAGRKGLAAVPDGVMPESAAPVSTGANVYPAEAYQPDSSQ